MEDAIRTWIEKRDESICRVCEGLKPDIALTLEAMSWLSQANWDGTKMPRLREVLLEYGKSPELIEEMRRQWKEWKSTPPPTPAEMMEKLSQ